MGDGCVFRVVEERFHEVRAGAMIRSDQSAGDLGGK